MNKYFLYVSRETWLHRLDPRTKILAVLGLFIIALAFSDPRYLIVPTLLVFLLLAAARALSNVAKIWVLLVLLLLYCVGLWPFFVSGAAPFVTIGGYTVTMAEGFGMGMGLRVNLMLLSGLFLLSTTTIEAFMLALQRLGFPAPASFALSLAFRWVPSLLGSAGTIVQAQRARGLDLAAGGLFTRLRRYPPLLVPLIGHQLRQTRLLAMALESKGFGPDVRRHGLIELRMRMADWAVLLGMAAAAALCLWLRWKGSGYINVGFS